MFAAYVAAGIASCSIARSCAEFDSGLDPGEEEARAQGATAGEGIEQANQGVAVREVWSVRRSQDVVIGGATGTAQLPAPSIRARAPRAAPMVVRSADGFADPGSVRPIVVSSSGPSFSSSALGSAVSHSQTTSVRKPACFEFRAASHVAGDVGGELVEPEAAIPGRGCSSGAAGMAVPVAAVDEDREAGPPVGEVGPAGKDANVAAIAEMVVA